MQRRSFIASILAAGVAPALAKAGWLMPCKAIQYATGGIVVPSGTMIEISRGKVTPAQPYLPDGGQDGDVWLQFKEGCVYVRRIDRWELISVEADTIRSAEFRTVFRA